MKKYIKVILIIIGIFILCIGLDIVSVITLNKPIFAIKENNDSVNIVYRGLLYDTYDCVEYKKSQIKIKGSKYTCPLVENNKVVNIKDTTKDINDFICLEALEQFYEDDNYKYYYNCIKDQHVLVEYSNGTKEKVSEALKKRIITISDLERYDISYIKESKQKETTITTTTTTKKISTTSTTTTKVALKNIKEIIDQTVGYSCASAMETFYEDDNFRYQFGCIKSESVIVKYNDGTEENVVSALEKGNIKITDLDKYSISYYKMEK